MNAQHAAVNQYHRQLVAVGGIVVFEHADRIVLIDVRRLLERAVIAEVRQDRKGHTT